MKKSTIDKLQNILYATSAKNINDATERDLYVAICMFLREEVGRRWAYSNIKNQEITSKTVYYISIQFQTQKLLTKGLSYLGLYEEIKEVLCGLGKSIANIENQETDLGLSEDGLERLAMDFIDSFATLGMDGHGYGLRLEQNNNLWEFKREEKSYRVRFNGNTHWAGTETRMKFKHVNYRQVNAIPYDVPVVGYKNDRVNTLRLWGVDSGDYISEYSDLESQYFYVSASIQDIFTQYANTGSPIADIHKHRAIHLNGTSAVLAIPETMRILIDWHDFTWDEAWDITVKTFTYVNHKLSLANQEYLDAGLFRNLLPRIWMIVEEINARFGFLSIVKNNQVDMQSLGMAGSVYKEAKKGILHRKWLLSVNSSLTDYLKELLGDQLETNQKILLELKKYSKNNIVLNQLKEIKQIHKNIITEYVWRKQGIKINPYSIFHLYIKGFKENEDQFLQILHIIYLYDKLKENPNVDMVPCTFIFTGNENTGNSIQQEVMRHIQTTLNIINHDNSIKEKLKIVFIPNFDRGLDKLLVPGVDVTEEIVSMQLTMNGAINIQDIQVDNEFTADAEVVSFHSDEFRNIYNLVLGAKGPEFLLKDFVSWRLRHEKINNLYRDQNKWVQMSLKNIGESGKFSVDEVVKWYADEVWDINMTRKE